MSAPTRLLLIRHAEPDHDVRGRVYGRTDVELSTFGRRQAERIAVLLRPVPIAAIYTSPLRRARATSAPLGVQRSLEPVVVDDLRELDFGELEGMTVEEVGERYPHEARWFEAPATARFPGGESVSDLRERALRAARGIVARHPGETAVAFSHSVPIRVILADALAMAPEAIFRLELDYGCISVVDWVDGGASLRALNLGSHL